MSATLKNILLTLGLITTLGFGYFVFLGNPQLEDTTNNGVAELDLKAARFLARVNELKQIELQSDVLSDQRFGSLVHYSGGIETEEVGTENPFSAR